MHPIVDLAVKTIKAFIEEGKTINPPHILSDEMRGKAGVFVSIHKKSALRGCIGTMSPTKDNVAKEVIANAISAATKDPRFPPIRADELKDLEVSVDVLSASEKIKDTSELDAKKYGVIVTSRGKRGLLLPNLEGVNTPEEQIAICRKKAWINEDEPIELMRFKVRRFH